MSFDRDRVESWLSQALAAGDGADGVEALFRGAVSSQMRLAEARVVQSSHVVEGRVMVRAVVGGREAYAVTTDLTPAGLRDCTRAAMDRAAACPSPAAPVALPEPGDAPRPVDGFDEPTAHLAAPDKERWLADALKAHRTDDLALAGRFHSGVRVLAVRSTTGVSAFHTGTFADLSLSSLERPAGHRASSSRALLDARIDEDRVRALAEETRAECRRAHDPVTVDPGAWDVVLAPAAVAELLTWLAGIGFTSRAIEDGLSFVEGRLGEAVTGDAVTLIDDGVAPYGLGIPLPFDAEGQPRRRITLLERGVARGGVHDSRSARRAGCAGTGHAVGPSLFGTGGGEPGHLHFEPGTASVDDLVARVDRGLFVTRFHYVNGLIEPRRAVMTGLLRDAAFLIEGGRMTRAVTPLRFTDSILEAFARIPGAAGVGRDLEPHGEWIGVGSTVCPHLLVPGLRFTSGR